MAVRIFNVSKRIMLADQAEIAGSFGRRLAGLIGRFTFSRGKALILKPCNAVHSFFMLFPIDVAFINDQGKVLATIKRMRPFKVCRPVRGATAVVELPAGVIETTGTELGDTLQFIAQ